MRTTRALLLLLAACGSAAQDGIDDRFLSDGKTDTGTIAEGSPEALGILAFVNAAGYDLLVGEVGLAHMPAANLVNYKIGDDGLVGTWDDQVFASLYQLDAIPYVGPKVFEALHAYALANGWIQGGGDAGWWGALDAGPWTPSDAAVWPDAAPWTPADAWVWSPTPDAGW
jgi:hypothetical protein